MCLRCTRLFELCCQGLRLLQQDFHLHQIHAGNRTDFESSGKDAERILAAGDGLTGQRDALIQFA